MKSKPKANKSYCKKFRNRNSTVVHKSEILLAVKIGILLCIIAFVVFLSQNSNADDKTKAKEWIIEEYDVLYKNMTAVYVNGTIEIHEALLFGENKTADDIRKLYKDNTTKEIILQNLTNKAEDIFRDMIKDIFPNSTTNFNRTKIYIKEETLFNDTDEDAYNIPILVIADADVFLTPKTYKMERVKKLEELILGVLKMGGVITKEINLSAEPGHKRIYNFFLPNGVKFLDGISAMEKIVDNLNATEYKKNIFEFSIADTSPNPSFTEEILVKINIEMNDFGNASIRIIASIDSVDMKNYDIPKTISNLYFVSDDGIRLGVETNLTSWNEVYTNSIKELKEDAEKKISKIFGNVSLNFYWENSSLIGYNITSMKGDDILCYLNGTIDKNEIYGLDKELVRGLVNSGASVNINLTLKGEYKYDNSLVLPKGYTLITNEKIVKGERDICLWNRNLKGEFIYKNSVNYSEEKKIIKVFLDMHTAELIFLWANLKADIIIASELYWVKLPKFFKEKLPEDVLMEYVNSDAIRISIDFKLITNEDIKNYTIEIKEKIVENISRTIGKNISANFEIVENSFANYDVEKMNGEVPIRMIVVAKFEHLINILSKNSLIEFSLRFSFDAIEGNTIYTIAFPRGVAIIDAKNTKGVKKWNENGREYIELNLNKGEKDSLELNLDLTLWFILEKLFPIIALSITAISILVYVRLRRSRRKRKNII